MSIKRLSNESGMIMLIVIAFILVMSILSAGIFSRAISKSMSSISQAKQVQAELLARGAYARAYDQLRQTPGDLSALAGGWTTETIGPVTYGIVFTLSGANNTVVTVQITYPD